MIPTRIVASNYRSFEEFDLLIPGGCVAIVGDNGAGKSSIVNAIELGLYAGRGELAQEVGEHGPNLELMIHFEHAGETYSVTRDVRGGKATLDLGRWARHGQEAESLSRETVAATQERIEEILGMSRRTFRASAFLAQGDGAAFTEAPPRDRKEILSDVLQLGRWEELRKIAHAWLTAAERDLNAAQHRRAVFADELEAGKGAQEERDEAAALVEEQGRKVGEAEARLHDASERLHEAREGLAALSAAREVARLADQQVRQETDRLRAVEESLRQAERALGFREELEAEVGEGVEEYERQVADAQRYDRLVEDHRVLLDAHEELSDKINAVAHGTCPACGQALGDSRDRMTRALNARLDENVRKRDEIMDILVDVGDWSVAEAEARLRQAREADRKLAEFAGFEQRAADLRDDAHAIRTNLPTLEEDHQIAKAALGRLDGLGDVEPLERDHLNAEAALNGARARLSVYEQSLAKLDARLGRLAEVREQANELELNVDELAYRVSEYELYERACGRDGIPAAVLEAKAIPYLEVEATRIVGELGLTGYRIELRTLRETKAGGLADALDIVIRGPRHDRLYESFSGGERTRLNLALRIALARLLAHRGGSRLLVIDEPDGLDAGGFEQLACVLRGLSGEFDKILVISHHPDLRDAFDQVIEVRKDGRSVIA